MALFDFLKKKENKVKNPRAIEIYIANNMNIALIPILHTKPGYGKMTDYFIVLSPPYTSSEIGKAFLKVLNDMKNEPVLNGNENIIPAFKIISGGKGFSAFQRNRQLIKVSFENEMKFQYWYKKSRGFGLDKGDKEVLRHLPWESKTDEIGKTIDTLYYEINHKHIFPDV